MDYELIFWIASAIAGWITFSVLWFLAKRESENHIGWIADGDWE